MAGIFINYRTDDAAAMAALIDRSLCAVFGDDQVFRDCRSMEPGIYFPADLRRRLVESTVLLAIIGTKWLTLIDSAGNPRLDNRKDYVRREIRKSLQREITVLPVLVDGAELPKSNQLPEDIRRLGEQQYVHIRTRYDRQDIDALVEKLKKHLPALPAGSDGARPGQINVDIGNQFSAPVRAERIVGKQYRYGDPGRSGT